LQVLLRQYGPLLGPEALRHALGYRTRTALQQARQRGQLPLRLFTLPGRHGHFALTHDLARWLTTLADPETSPADAGGSPDLKSASPRPAAKRKRRPAGRRKSV
jgi:hypothetical protein